MHKQKDEIAAEHQRGLPQAFRALLELGLRPFFAFLPLLPLLAELNPLAKFDERLNQEE